MSNLSVGYGPNQYGPETTWGIGTQFTVSEFPWMHPIFGALYVPPMETDWYRPVEPVIIVHPKPPVKPPVVNPPVNPPGPPVHPCVVTDTCPPAPKPCELFGTCGGPGVDPGPGGPSPVPEPGAYVLFLTGLIIVMLMKALGKRQTNKKVLETL